MTDLIFSFLISQFTSKKSWKIATMLPKKTRRNHAKSNLLKKITCSGCITTEYYINCLFWVNFQNKNILLFDNN